MIATIKALTKDRNFVFYIDKEGEPTVDKYGENYRNAELFITQRPTDPKLTAVMIEGMSDTHPHLNKALEFLITVDEKFKVARLRLDNNPKITVQDFIDQNKHDGGMPEFVYHGTSAKSAKDILENGLKPRDLTNEPAKYKTIQSGESLKDRVYLCTFGNMGSAKFASRQSAAYDKSKPVILKIATSKMDTCLLMPDEDSKKSTWQESLNGLGTLAYKGVINPSEITFAEDLTLDLNDGVKLTEFMKTLEGRKNKTNTSSTLTR
jgi:hypothetical protein